MTRLVPSLSALAALARRPDLWPTAARLALVLTAARPGWPSAYLRFRHQTMFGADADARLSGDQLVDYLAWCAMMRRVARAQHRTAQSTAASRTGR